MPPSIPDEMLAPQVGRDYYAFTLGATDDGEVIFRARWKERAIDLQRRIVFRMRAGMPLWFEDDAGRDLCFKPERVWRAVVADR